MWEKFEKRNSFDFGNPPSEKNDISLNTQYCLKILLKQPIFCSTEAFKVFIYIWENPENLDYYIYLDQIIVQEYEPVHFSIHIACFIL